MRFLFTLSFAVLALANPILVQYEESYHIRNAYWGPQAQYSLGLPGDENQSIYDVLKANDEFSYLTKAIEFTETVDFYKDPSLSITFFAPPNKAFPKRPHHGDDDDAEDEESMLNADPGRLSLEAVMDRVEALEKGDKGDKEKRRKILKEIAHAILSYHTLPNAIDSSKLSVNTTQPTALILPEEINYARPLRIKVSSAGIRPSLRLNMITRVVEPDVAASNGLIHVISFPLIPPFPAFAELFQVPSAFSILTSAIQRTRIADELDIRYVHHKDQSEHHGKFVGAKAATVFAPTNKAFERLPLKLQLFLFSPLGTHVLRKVLQFHIIPDYVIHSDYLFEAECATDAFVPPPIPEPIFDVKKSFPTLLKDHKVEVHVSKFNFTVPIPGPNPLPPRIVTKLEVEGQTVGVTDVPAANGAIHVIDHILNPKKHHHGPHKPSHPRIPLFNVFDNNDSWEDWEDWLVDWANQV